MIIMTITQIQQLGRNKACVTLDDEIQWILPPSVVRERQLCPGQELSEDIYTELYENYVLKAAKLKALDLLRRRDHTEKELREKLTRQGFDPETVRKAVAYVDSYHYLDDERYVRSYLLSASSGKSRQVICQTLAAKGIDPQTIQDCMEELELDDTENIRKICEKKFGDLNSMSREQRQKVFQYFLRRGYKYGDIASIIKEFHSI